MNTSLSSLSRLAGLAAAVLLPALACAAPAPSPARLIPEALWPGTQRGLAVDVQTAGGFVYVLLRDEGGLAVYTNGVQVSSLALPTGAAMQLDGALLWVAVNNWTDKEIVGSGIQAIDISNPYHPRLRSQFWLSQDPISSLQVCDGLAYVASSGYGLDIVNVSDLDAPEYAGGYYTASEALSLRVSRWSAAATNTPCGLLTSNLVFLAGGSSGLWVLDASIPSAVTRLSGYATTGPATDVQLETNTFYGSNWVIACVTEGVYGLEGVSFSDILAPSQAWPALYSTNTSVYAASVQLGSWGSRRLAYVSAHHAGVQIYDITNPTNILAATVTNIILGEYAVSGSARRLSLSGNRAFVAAREGGVQVLDITSPTNAVWTNAFGGAGFAHDVALAGSYAYLADGNGGLKVLNVANPRNPLLAGSFQTNGLPPYYDLLPDARRVCVLSNRVYLLDYTYGLQILTNADHPAQMAQAGLLSLGGGKGLDVEGNLACIVTESGSLILASVADPANPAFLCSFVLGPVESVRVLNGSAYVCNGAGLQILDVSACPIRWRSQINTGGWASGVDVVNGLAYVTDQWTGLKVIDVADPRNPVLKGCFPAYGTPTSVRLAGSTAYVAGLGGGLDLLDAPSLTGLAPGCLATNSPCDCPPTNSPRLGGITLGEPVSSAAVSGNWIFAAQGRAGLAVLSQTNAGAATPQFEWPGYAVSVWTNAWYTNTDAAALMDTNRLVSNQICSGASCTNLPGTNYWGNVFQAVTNWLQTHESCVVSVCTNSTPSNGVSTVLCTNLAFTRWYQTNYFTTNSVCASIVTTNFWAGPVGTNYSFTVFLNTGNPDRHTYVMDRMEKITTNWVAVDTNTFSGPRTWLTDPAATNRQSYYRVRVLP